MTYFDDIYELAVDNYGIITSAEARELGISDKGMNSLTKRGRITRHGHVLINWHAMFQHPTMLMQKPLLSSAKNRIFMENLL